MQKESNSKISPPPPSEEKHKQEPFSRAAPILKTALLMGAGGGFLLATILTVTYAVSVPPGAWWEAVAQAHGHLQLYGWAGLFVVGVALHFLPRLRGTPLVGAHRIPWNYGPFVRLVASAYLWAIFGALLLLINGMSALATGKEQVALDAIRHGFALGFIALLICGIASRMLPSFSGGKIVSPKLVSATFWLGNTAVVLRVGSILLAPLLSSTQGIAINAFLFGLSGPCGLALAICLAINLWPSLRSSP